MSFDRKEYTKQYRLKNLEKIRKYQREWQDKNKDRFRETKRKYNRTNKQKISDYMKDWRKRNKDKVNKHRQEYFKRNAQFLLEEGLLTDCIICGYPKERYAAIDWHHINPNQKEYQMSILMRNACKSRLLKEAKKCVCMCRNCHMEYHNNYKDVVDKYKKEINNK